MSVHDEACAEVESYCHDDIICPDCHEHTTRHEPCCAGTPQCECVECKTCSALAPELTAGRCGSCHADYLDYLEGLREDAADANDWWKAKL